MEQQNVTTTRIKIFLNIYDLSKINKYTDCLGLGAYHSGIEIGPFEYSFGAHEGTHTGVYQSSEPKTHINAIFRKSVQIGETEKTFKQIQDIIEELKIEYIGCSYDILKKNCNHFSEDLCFKLLNKHIPNYTNRVARLGQLCRCCFSKQFIQGWTTEDSFIDQKAMDSVRIAKQKLKDKYEISNESSKETEQVGTFNNKINKVINAFKKKRKPNQQQQNKKKLKKKHNILTSPTTQKFQFVTSDEPYSNTNNVINGNNDKDSSSNIDVGQQKAYTLQM